MVFEARSALAVFVQANRCSEIIFSVRSNRSDHSNDNKEMKALYPVPPLDPWDWGSFLFHSGSLSLWSTNEGHLFLMNNIHSARAAKQEQLREKGEALCLEMDVDVQQDITKYDHNLVNKKICF